MNALQRRHGFWGDVRKYCAHAFPLSLVLLLVLMVSLIESEFFKEDVKEQLLAASSSGHEVFHVLALSSTFILIRMILLAILPIIALWAGSETCLAFFTVAVAVVFTHWMGMVMTLTVYFAVLAVLALGMRLVVGKPLPPSPMGTDADAVK